MSVCETVNFVGPGAVGTLCPNPPQKMLNQATAPAHTEKLSAGQPCLGKLVVPLWPDVHDGSATSMDKRMCDKHRSASTSVSQCIDRKNVGGKKKKKERDHTLKEMWELYNQKGKPGHLGDEQRETILKANNSVMRKMSHPHHEDLRLTTRAVVTLK